MSGSEGNAARRACALVSWLAVWSAVADCAKEHAPAVATSSRADAGSTQRTMPSARATPARAAAQADASAAPSVAEAGVPPRANDAGAIDAGSASPPQASCRLTFTYTTKPTLGLYSPTNIGAAWIEDASGKLIHTMEYWSSGIFDKYLTRYLGAGGIQWNYTPIAQAFGSPPPTKPPDLISSATLHGDRAHLNDSWDCRDANQAEVPNGPYRAVAQFYEGRVGDASVMDSAPVLEVSFELGRQPFATTPNDGTHFVDVKLTLE
jgi:hypothetical protein